MLDNPIDEVWGDLDERPPRSKEPLEILDVKYAGKLHLKK